MPNGEQEDKDTENKLNNFTQEELDEFVLAVKSQEASDINNSGKEEQIKFLIDAGVKIYAHG